MIKHYLFVHLFKNIIEHQFVLAIMLSGAMVSKAIAAPPHPPSLQFFTCMCYNTKSYASHSI